MNKRNRTALLAYIAETKEYPLPLPDPYIWYWLTTGGLPGWIAGYLKESETETYYAVMTEDRDQYFA